MAERDDNQVTDETLVETYHSGDERSFETLYYRYFKPIGFYIRKNSIYKDDDFIEEIRQVAFIKLSEKIKSGGFTPAGPGSFRAFLYETARNICFNHNKSRMRLIKPVSEMFTDEELPGIDELVLTKDIGIDYDEINDRINGITAQITPAELELMKLVAAKIKHNDIIQNPLFAGNSLASLKQKIYNIRKKISKPRRGTDGATTG